MSTTAVAPEATQTPILLEWVRVLISAAFIVAVVLGLISINLRSLVLDRDFMLQGFLRNQVALTTGLDQPQLERIADAFVAYFQAPPGQIQLDVVVAGQHRPLFNDREVAHMEDVQRLIQFFLNLLPVVAVVVVVRLLQAVVIEHGVARLGRDLVFSVGLMVAIVLFVAIASAIDFDDLWTRFHEVAFRNDLWQLDPTRDYLIMLFPEPFWFAATVRLALGIALQSLVLAVVGVLAWRFGS
ncbi:MAG: TIGR01906 family membrane protein [Chloroflexi bacterium]|nr:TIGR01906 family membrane protein [Chloroflexota bacterium]